MPNGRSGGFPIATVELKRLVRETADSESFGTLMSFTDPSKPRNESVKATEILRLVSECTQESVAIEEQDQTSYIIHLSNDPVVWVLVGPNSPAFDGLKQYHDHWEREHPDWDGWLGF
jgi:hypothetical protein